jgi:hypothetical protein
MAGGRVRPPAARHPGEEDMMLVEHQHKPGVFDPGHCRDCAREADLLDHYWRVQREERAFTEAHRWASLGLPAGQLGAVVLRHRDRAGRGRAPGRLIHVDAQPGWGQWYTTTSASTVTATATRLAWFDGRGAGCDAPGETTITAGD